MSPTATESGWDIVKSFQGTGTISMRGDPLVGLSHEFPTSQRQPTVKIDPKQKGHPTPSGDSGCAYRLCVLDKGPYGPGIRLVLGK